jgi:hypothetical protein
MVFLQGREPRRHDVSKQRLSRHPFRDISEIIKLINRLRLPQNYSPVPAREALGLMAPHKGFDSLPPRTSFSLSSKYVMPQR